MVTINPAAWLGGSHVFNGREITRYEILMVNLREQAERVARGKGFALLEVVPRRSFQRESGGTGIRTVEAPEGWGDSMISGANAVLRESLQ